MKTSEGQREQGDVSPWVLLKLSSLGSQLGAIGGVSPSLHQWSLRAASPHTRHDPAFPSAFLLSDLAMNLWKMMCL